MEFLLNHILLFSSLFDSRRVLTEASEGMIRSLENTRKPLPLSSLDRIQAATHHPDMDQLDVTSENELRALNRYAEATRSLSVLPMVHERQTQRMKTRSEWFLQDSPDVNASKAQQQLIRRTSSKEKRRAARLEAALRGQIAAATIASSVSAKSVRENVPPTQPQSL